jgi:uncharacterized protein (DUF58 family)
MNNILWFLLAILALVLAWFTESTALAWTMCAFILALGASRILVLFTPRIFASRAVSTNFLHPGERVRVWVRMRLSHKPWGWLLATDGASGLPLIGERGKLVGPAGNQQVEFSYSLEAKRRGYYAVGPLNTRFSDPLGFAEKRESLLESEYITVFPRVIGMGRMRVPLARAPGELHSLRRTFEDPTRPAGVREYRHGDALRRVHWRATAHAGKPQSKIYDVSTSLQAMIVLNLHRSEYPASPDEAIQISDLAISLAASLGVHLLARGQRVGIISNGLDVREREDLLQETGARLSSESVARLSDELAANRRVLLPPTRTPQRQLELLSLLARLLPAKGRTLAELLSEVRRHLSWGEAIILITPSVDNETVERLVTLNHAGFSLLPLIVGDSPLAGRAELLLAAARLGSHRVLWEEDISELFA